MNHQLQTDRLTRSAGLLLPAFQTFLEEAEEKLEFLSFNLRRMIRKKNEEFKFLSEFTPFSLSILTFDIK